MHIRPSSVQYMANAKLFVLLARAATMSPWILNHQTSDLDTKFSYNQLVSEHLPVLEHSSDPKSLLYVSDDSRITAVLGD